MNIVASNILLCRGLSLSEPNPRLNSQYFEAFTMCLPGRLLYYE